MTITQKIADQIEPYMKDHSFCYLKKCFYKIQDDIVFCVQFDATEGFVYATYYVMPLYIPCSTRYYSYGHRITAPNSQLSALSRDASDGEIKKWCKLLCCYIEKNVLSFFHRISTPKQLVKYVERKLLVRQNVFSCPRVQSIRLLMFSYLYMEDYKTLTKTIRKYEKAIRKSSFFTNEVRSRYLHEVNAVKQLVEEGNDESRKFCSTTIADTISKCFS